MEPGWLAEIKDSKLRETTAQVLQATETHPPREAWAAILDALPRDAGHFVFWNCWQSVFERLPASEHPAPMWFPELQASPQACPLLDWMRDESIEQVSQFHRWSIDNRGPFWESAIQRLGIEFQSQPNCTLDVSRGAESAAWLPGARLNIAEQCFQAPDTAPAIVAGKTSRTIQTLTYGELKAQSFALARAIRARGFAPGDCIAVYLPMTTESVIAYLGIILAGCVVVSIADSFAPPEIAKRLQIANAKAAITYDSSTRLGKAILLYENLKQADAPMTVVIPEGDTLSQATRLREGDIAWHDLLSAGSEREFDDLPFIATADDPINVLFSSGTTGTPKAIPWTHSTPLKCAADAMLLQGVAPGDVLAWPTNLGWMMGPWLIFAALLRKATIALFEDAPVTREFGKFVQETRVTMLGVIPTIVRAWRKPSLHGGTRLVGHQVLQFNW